MTRTDYNKYLLSLNLDKETFERLQQLAMTMVSNGMNFEECAKIVEKKYQQIHIKLTRHGGYDGRKWGQYAN